MLLTSLKTVANYFQHFKGKGNIGYFGEFKFKNGDAAMVTVGNIRFRHLKQDCTCHQDNDTTPTTKVEGAACLDRGEVLQKSDRVVCMTNSGPASGTVLYTDRNTDQSVVGVKFVSR